MIAFAHLLERLVFTPGRLAKIALLRRYFESQPDPDRGFGLAALTGELVFDAAKPGLIRALAEARTDPVLFGWSHDYVGDLAETVALIWPARRTNAGPPTMTEVVQTLLSTPKSELSDVVAGWLDASNVSVRFALLKLITGALRVGASARLAKIALSELAGGRIEPDQIEEVWHGLVPPYEPLFAWLEGRGDRPDPAGAPVFRPPMLAQALEDADIPGLDPSEYRAEWKWDGIRVQLVSTPLGRRIFSRGADDVSAAFPEILGSMHFQGVLDGEMLVVRNGEVASFSDLQQRLNRKAPSAKMLKEFPVCVRLYDILFEGHEDLRPLPFDERRRRLEAWHAAHQLPRMSLSELVPFSSMQELAEIRAGARAASIEGLMLKRRDSPYVPGRPKGLWWKWKRDPLTVDAVLMYAQRGSGKRSSFYSDYTFGLWREDGELVPVGKAYFGFTDAELVQLDRWIRNHTINRFGPVREVERSYVLEIAFDAAQRSSRHKSGVALRFPRVHRLRPDKPAAEADRLETLVRLIETNGQVTR
ncbi:MAG: cisplatin damage response ATP-dependent DNA ligase [Acetobacteraceae bacterium]|nr:cisplatin damage response ATP-dependent DNA ligase [Acetobacteraceae bacterium]